METLEIIIGLVFIYLLLSLLATTIQEIIASLLSMRGRVLLQAIAKLMEIENLDEWTDKTRAQVLKEFKKRVMESKVYRKYSSRFLWIRQFPSYLSSEQVAEVLTEVMQEDATAEEQVTTRGVGGTTANPNRMRHITNSRLQKNLNLMMSEEPAEPAFQTRGLSDALENMEERVKKAQSDFDRYYNEAMDRATGWYKRNVTRNLIIIGLLLGLVFDADTFKIYTNLTNNPDDRKELIELAVTFVDEDRLSNYAIDTTGTLPDSVQFEALKNTLNNLLIEEINQVPPPLGLGRTDGFPAKVPEGKNEIWWRLTKLLGWIVTALAISMGAPFWFDILKRLIHIRNAGNKPDGQL